MFLECGLHSPNLSSANICKLMDWSGNQEVVAEGRWASKEPNTFVNGLLIRPNEVKVFVDVVIQPDTFLWRPTAVKKTLEDSLKSFIIWPANRVQYLTSTDATPQSEEATPILQTRSSELEKSAPTPSPPLKKSKKVIDSPVRRSPVI